MRVERNRYLKKLVDRMHNGMIKVITGIRRSGKSYLLFEIFVEYLKNNGTDEEHIIKVEFDKRENALLRDPDKILEYINSQIKDKKDYYILLDEVQMLSEFEEVLNSLLHIRNVDVYVTGSNSRFLSKDVITEFRGRGDEVHIYPLSFAEYMTVHDADMYKALAGYMTYGGLPLTVTMRSEEQKSVYLTSLFEETYINLYYSPNDSVAV